MAPMRVHLGLVVLVLLASPVALAGKVKFIDVVDPNAFTTPKAMLSQLETMKPGPARDALMLQLDTKLREKGTPLDDAEQLDALAGLLFQKILEDMAAPTDVWTWEGDDSPRGDVLIREKLLLFPGRVSSAFAKELTVTPKGKRIDRAYADTACKVLVLPAKSEPEWQAWVETKGWGAAVHEVRWLDDVARVAATVTSPGKSGAPGPRHQRPAWVGYFKRAKKADPWAVALFAPATAKDQKAAEANVSSLDAKVRAGDAFKKQVLALRMEDVRLVPATHATLSPHEERWFSLAGLTECPVEAKTIAWLEPYRADPSPMVRAAAVVKLLELGGKPTGGELADILVNIRIHKVAADAQRLLDAMLDAGNSELTDEQKGSLAQLAGAGEVRSLPDVVRVKSQGKTTYFRKAPYGWEEVKKKDPVASGK